MTLYQKHQDSIKKAIEAVHRRDFYAHYPEMPSGKIYGETANEEGKLAFEAFLNQKFNRLSQSIDTDSFGGEENSPYTQNDLGIQYPLVSTNTLISNSKKAASVWKKTNILDRAGILVESLDAISTQFFEIAYATMHTTGQSFMMSFQASGPHANDRALETIAIGLEEWNRYPDEAIWEKPMGKMSVKLKKSWQKIPKGVGLVIGCSTFPVWNSLPGIYANLICGNPVIFKPHPKAVLPIAIAIAEIQRVLKENGLDPNICQMAADISDNLITKDLAAHRDVKLIDYTGSSAFGDYIESIPGKTSFTEKAGVNSAIIDSTADLNAAMQNLAFSVSLYSGQMCTAPQNFFIPETGINNNGEHVSYQEVVDVLVNSVNGLVNHPKMGAGTLGALQNPATLARVEESKTLGAKVLLNSEKVSNGEFPEARTVSPLLLEVSADQTDIYNKELFGPIAIVVKTKDTNHSIQLAKEMAATKGALSCAVYATESAVQNDIIENMAQVGAPVSLNLVGPIWVNQHAGFSDFHVTGGNPAGNASFTNPEFILRRFTLVGTRTPV